MTFTDKEKECIKNALRTRLFDARKAYQSAQMLQASPQAEEVYNRASDIVNELTQLLTRFN